MTPTFPDLWASLDSDKIAAAILADGGEEKLKDYDFQDAKQCVYEAAAEWLEYDLENFVVDRVELGYDDGRFKGILDLEGFVRPDVKDKRLVNYAGKRFVVDWKTSRHQLATEWRKRHRLSWQWKHYARTNSLIELFIFRGIRRPQSVNGPVETNELPLAMGNGVAQVIREEAANQLIGIIALRDALVNSGLEVWPMHQPDACIRYGKPCPFTEDCEDMTMPRQCIQDSGPLSYSSMKNLLTCPELFRRLKLLREQGKDDAEFTTSEETVFGLAVHRGLAEVYRQAFNLT